MTYELMKIKKRNDINYIRVMWREYGFQVDVPVSIVTSGPKWKNAMDKIRRACEENEVDAPDEERLLNRIKAVV